MLIAFELMYYLEHKKEGIDGFAAIKLDMSKAYDRLEWGFIKLVMIKMGFHEKWVELIMHCITSISYSILVNGVAYGNIIPTMTETLFRLIFFFYMQMVFPLLFMMLPKTTK